MKAKFRSTKSVDDVNVPDNKGPRVEELVELITYTPNDWKPMRLVGPVASYGRHWVPTGKTNAKGMPIRFPAMCLSYDPETGEHNSEKQCPWCDDDSGEVQFSPQFYSNVIDRQAQENEPEKKRQATEKEESTGFKQKSSKTWTPVRVLSISGPMARDIKRQGALNRHKDKESGEMKVYKMSHKRYGCDLNVMHSPDEKQASKKWSVAKGDKSSLSEEEQEYLLWDIENLMEIPSLKEAKRDYEGWAKRYFKDKKKGDDNSDLEDGDNIDADRPRSKRRDPEEEEEEERPKKKKRPDDDGLEEEEPAPKKKRPVDDEADFESDEPPKKKRRPDPEEEEEEEPPKKKRRPDPEEEEEEAPPKKRRPDPDDEFDEPPPKKKRPDPEDDGEEPPPKKKRPPADDDFEDEPAPKKKRPPAEEEEEEAPPKKKRPPDDDADIDSLDEEEPPKKKRRPDPEEEEEEPPKKKRRPDPEEEEEEPAPKKKRPPADDDDF